MSQRIKAALNLRRGEGGLFLVLGSYLFLLTATTTLLIAVKNGLFLSVYPASYVPYAMILAAVLTAVVSVTFSGFAARVRSRDAFARGFLLLAAGSLGLCWLAFRLNPATAFGIYLWLVSANTLMITQGWTYVAGSLNVRQGKRLMPVIGMGGSVASIAAGVALGPLVFVMGTEHVLLVAGGLVLVTIPLLGRVSPPDGSDSEWEAPEREGFRAFLDSSSRGFRSLKAEPLLGLLAGAVVLVMVASTLIDYLFKVRVQDAFDRDSITLVYGLLAGSIGVASLAFQLAASRFVFPRFGVSLAAMGHAGTLALNAAAVAVFGGIPLVFLLQVMDDSLRSSIERPAEQVSLLPFPRRIKEPAYTTISGVLRPLARALTAWAAIFLALWPLSLPIATMVAAGGAALLYSRHRRLYLQALEGALARHSVELRPFSRTQLVLDREGLKVLDEALTDSEPTVVVFALTLLPRLPPKDGIPLLLPRFEHPRAEVRAEAAKTLASFDEEDVPDEEQTRLLYRLDTEQDPMALAAMIETVGRWQEVPVQARLEAFLDHGAVDARRAALVALGKRGWSGTRDALIRLLSAGSVEERAAGISAVGELGLSDFLSTLAQAMEVAELRSPVLRALERIGTPALPVIVDLARDEALDVHVRRRVVATLGNLGGAAAVAHLAGLLGNREVADTALRELRRLRQSHGMEPLDRKTTAPLLRDEVGRALHYAAVATALRDQATDADPRAAWVATELEGMSDRGLRHALGLLSLSYDPVRILAVEQGLDSNEVERQSSAIELLEGMLEYEDAALVVPLCETRTEGGCAAAPAAAGALPGGDGAGPISTLTGDAAWFPRALGLYASPQNGVTHGRRLDPEEQAMVTLMQKVMILKGSELFRTFSGEELAGIAELAEERFLDQDEVLFHQGDVGDAFYVVVNGAVAVLRDGRELTVLGPREGFGEMAILDHEERSATVQAREASTLLRIDEQSFDRMVDLNPAIAKGMYRVLSRRLRSTSALVAKG